MSNLLDNFKKICVMDTTLPSGKSVKIQRLNIDFQRNLVNAFDQENTPTVLALKYIQFINNYLLTIFPEIQYVDKLFILNKWIAEFANTKEDNTKDFANISFDKEVNLNINNNNIKIHLYEPNVTTENLLIDFLLQKETSDDIDLSFFDNFRFIKSITLNDSIHESANITIDELYELYLLFDLTSLQELSDNINSTLNNISSIRTIEADFSFFIDL